MPHRTLCCVGTFATGPQRSLSAALGHSVHGGGVGAGAGGAAGGRNSDAFLYILGDG